MIKIERIILDFGNTLVQVFENGSVFFIKFSGEITSKECLEFMFRNCKKSFSSCNEFEKLAFYNEDDV